MRTIRFNKIALGLLAIVALSIALCCIIGAREASVRSRVQEITSIPSVEALVDRLGKPDAAVVMRAGTYSFTPALAFEYYDSTFRVARKTRFPFIKLSRKLKRTTVFILGTDRMSQLPQINEGLQKSYWEYNHAVVVHDCKTSPNEIQFWENFARYHNLLKQTKQNNGLQVDADARRE
jgi:hypothetical protein